MRYSEMSRSRQLAPGEAPPVRQVPLVAGEPGGVGSIQGRYAAVLASGLLDGAGSEGYVYGSAQQLLALIQGLGFVIGRNLLDIVREDQLADAQRQLAELRTAFALGMSKAVLQRLVERP